MNAAACVELHDVTALTLFPSEREG